MPATVDDSMAYSSAETVSSNGPFASVKAVPQKEAGRILNPVNLWIAAGLTLAPIPVGLAGAIGGLVLAATLYSKIPVAAGALHDCGSGVRSSLCFRNRHVPAFFRQPLFAMGGATGVCGTRRSARTA